MHATDLYPAQVYWLGAGLCGAVAFWALYRCFRNLWRNRMVSDTPWVRIRSAAQGYVKLAGRAAPVDDQPLAAPLSSRPCVWWRYRVDQKTRNARDEATWETIDSGSSIDLFVLADGEDRCLVGPVNAEITPTTCDVWCGTQPRPGKAPMSPVRQQDGDFRYTEELLSSGDRLSVLGELRSHSEISDPDDSVAAVLHRWKQDQNGLLARFDKDRDGRLDASEWETARQAAEGESRSKTNNSRVSRQSVISQPSHGEPFLIAGMDDVRLVRRERLHAVLFFSLGVTGIALCAWAIEYAHKSAETGGRGFERHANLPFELVLWALICGGGALASRFRNRA